MSAYVPQPNRELADICKDASCAGEVLAVIPARGGSKGLKRKNVLPLHGKPLIAYTIEVALRCSTIDRVIISTEDDEIAAVAREHGAEVPFRRPAEIAGDKATLAQVIDNALANLSREGYVPGCVVTLLPTHPFRTPDLVDFLVRKVSRGPFQAANTYRLHLHQGQHFFTAEHGMLRPLSGGPWEGRTTPFLRSYGLVGAMRVKRPGPRYSYAVKNPASLVDIDTMADFRLAEEILRRGFFDFRHSQDPGSHHA